MWPSRTERQSSQSNRTVCGGLSDTRDTWRAVPVVAKVRQFGRTLKVLAEHSLVEKRTFKLRGYPTRHTRLREDFFLAR